MRLRSTILPALIAFSTAYAHFPPRQQPATIVRGLVVDSLLSGVAGATIEIVQRRQAVITGRDGDFRFLNIPSGSYDLRISGDGVREETIPMLTVVASNSTCVLFVANRSRPASNVVTGAATSPLLVLNGVVVFSSESRPRREPNTVVQIRHPWPPENIVSNTLISGDSAQRRFGVSASYGAQLVTTRSQAPCADS
jgi:hypothetical protein